VKNAFKPDLQDGSQWITIDGINIRYLRQGDSNHKSLVLLHGFGGSLDTFKENICFLSESYDVIALDFPGFGFSDKPGIRYSIHFQVLKLKRFLDQMNIGDIYLLGHSMGGAIAIHFAHLFASRVKKLILVCNAGMGKQISGVLRLSAMPLSTFFIGWAQSGLIEQMLNNCVYDKDIITKDLVDLYQNIVLLPGAPHAFVSQLQSFVTVFGQEKSFLVSTKGNLSQLIMPTLIVWGKNDRIIPPHHAEIAHQNIQQSNLIYYDNCGHLPQMEKVKEFNESVMAFLNDSLTT